MASFISYFLQIIIILNIHLLKKGGRTKTVQCFHNFFLNSYSNFNFSIFFPENLKLEISIMGTLVIWNFTQILKVPEISTWRNIGKGTSVISAYFRKFPDKCFTIHGQIPLQFFIILD